jgi:hypothetical protein
MPNLEMTLYTDFGEHRLCLPARYEVCDRCGGEGKHSDPRIDGNGITEDEWNGPEWSEEERETYLSGGYGVTCHDCSGERVIPVLDEERFVGKPARERLLRRINSQRKDDADYERLRGWEGLWEIAE